MFEFGHYQLDPVTVRLLKNNKQIDVEPQVFNTLLLLIENRERVITKAELLEKIWSGRPVTDHVITRIIYELRKILDDKDVQNSHIRTVRGKGYQFSIEVTVKEQAQIAAVDLSLPVKPKSNTYLYPSILIVLLLLSVLGVFILLNRPSK